MTGGSQMQLELEGTDSGGQRWLEGFLRTWDFEECWGFKSVRSGGVIGIVIIVPVVMCRK